MRSFSRGDHPHLIRPDHPGGMPVRDPALPASTDLLGEAAGDLLSTALEGVAEVRRWWRSQVRHLPGRILVVRYGVDVVWPDGTTSVETVVAEHGPASRARDASVLERDDGARVAVWRYPFDPYLPGLSPAAHARPVRAMLDHLGVPPGPVRVTPWSYRPTRRAVLEVVADVPDGPRRWFLKVLTRRRAARVHRVHAAVAAAVRAPHPDAAALDQGVLLLSAVPGRPLRDLLLDPAAPLPAAADVVALQRRLAGVDTGLDAPPARPFGVARHVEALSALLPEHADLVAAVGRRAEAAAQAPTATIHGDLYDAQLLVADDGTIGLVDLDGTGPGAVVDDAATMLGHLHVLARWRPAAADRILRWAADYRAAVEPLVEPVALDRRTAGALLGMAANAVNGGDDGWREEALGRLELAARLSGTPRMSTFSRSSHLPVIDGEHGVTSTT